MEVMDTKLTGEWSKMCRHLKRNARRGPIMDASWLLLPWTTLRHYPLLVENLRAWIKHTNSTGRGNSHLLEWYTDWDIRVPDLFEVILTTFQSLKCLPSRSDLVYDEYFQADVPIKEPAEISQVLWPFQREESSPDTRSTERRGQGGPAGV